VDGEEWSTSKPGPFTPEKQPWYPLKMRPGGSQNPSGRSREEKNLTFLAGIQTHDRLDRSVVAVMLSVMSKIVWLTYSLAEINISTLPTAQ
jgi:hypothetical protein